MHHASYTHLRLGSLSLSPSLFFSLSPLRCHDSLAAATCDRCNGGGEPRRCRVAGGGAIGEPQQEAEEEVSEVGAAKRREKEEVEEARKGQTEGEKKEEEERGKPARRERKRRKTGSGKERRRGGERGERGGGGGRGPRVFSRREGYFLVIRPGGARRLRRYNHNAARFKTTETGHGGLIAATRSYRSPRQPRTVRQTRLHHGCAAIAEHGLR